MKISIKNALPAWLTIGLFLFGVTFYFLGSASLVYAKISFHDLDETDALYTPYIKRMREVGLIHGYTQGGELTGEFRPKNLINRSEFSKLIAVLRVAEKDPSSHQWRSLSQIELDNTMNKALVDYYNCSKGACSLIGGKPFVDVLEKDPECDLPDRSSSSTSSSSTSSTSTSTSSSSSTSSKLNFLQSLFGQSKPPLTCEPWYSQYVYYLANRGMVKGYLVPNTTQRRFHPEQQILRIHALKMILANNGEIDPETDDRFKALNDRAISYQSISPKCLMGSELEILKANGGNTKDSQKLLKYALLADRLDLFGNNCQLLKTNGANTPSSITSYLQSPMTRQEALRFMNIASLYKEVQLNPDHDPTVNGRLQNKAEGITNLAYTPPVVPEGLEGSSDSDSGNTTKTQSSFESSFEGDWTDEKNQTMLDGTLGPKNNPSSSASGLGPIDYSGIDIDGFTAINKKGRCCRNQSWYPDRYCKVIDYSDYNIDSTAVIADTYPISKWYKAQRKWAIIGGSCWINQEDIINQFKTKEDIYDELERDLLKNNSINETCDSALFDKQEGTREYGHIAEWCNVKRGMPPKLYISSPDILPIDRQYYATGSTYYGGDNPVPFQIKKLSRFNSIYSDNSRHTYILIHGWNSDSDAWASSMAKSIKSTDPTAQIMAIDWSSIAGQLSFKKDYKLSYFTIIAPGITSAIDYVRYYLPEFPRQISKWIRPMARELVYPLTRWGIDPSRTTIIGHSLGSFYANELATFLESNLSSKFETRRLINRIALDPAAFIFRYLLDFDNPKAVMDGFGDLGACFVADGSLAGSETLMKTCKEKYIIKYNDPYGKSFVYKIAGQFAAEFTVNILGDIAEEKLKKLKTNTYLSYDEDLGKVAIKLVTNENGKDLVIAEMISFVEGGIFKAMCTYVGAADRILLSACEAGLKTFVDNSFGELTKAIVKKHNWVHSTYDEVINYPFNGKYLTPRDIASRIYKEVPIFNKNIYKGADGVIYTERDKPRNLKYLKVVDPKTPDYYTLYGNSKSNVLECGDRDKDCIMYGLGGANTFITSTEDSDSILKDFSADNKNDKLIVRVHFKRRLGCIAGEGKVDQLMLLSADEKYDDGCVGSGPNVKVFIRERWKDILILKDETRYVTFNKHNKDDVWDWIAVSTKMGKYKSYSKNEIKEKQKNNPIRIK